MPILRKNAAAGGDFQIGDMGQVRSWLFSLNLLKAGALVHQGGQSGG
jgi:hypothetical protein